jgi:hypothetical protein
MFAQSSRRKLLDLSAIRAAALAVVPLPQGQVCASTLCRPRLLVPGGASPNVGAVGTFLNAEETHVRKNLPLRHEGNSENGGKPDEIGKLQKPIAFPEEDVESVEEEQQEEQRIHASVETGDGDGEDERRDEPEYHQSGREIGKHYAQGGQDEQGDQDVVQDGIAPLPFGIGHGGDRQGEGVVGADLPLIGFVDLFRRFSRLPLLDHGLQYRPAF